MHRFAGDSAADIFEDEMSMVERFESETPRAIVAVKPVVAGAPDQQDVARVIMRQIANHLRANADRIDAALKNDQLSKAVCLTAMKIDISSPKPMDVSSLMFAIALEPT